MSRKAWGRGLEALIPQEVKETLNAEKIIRLPVDEVKSNPRQPRKRFDAEGFKDGEGRSVQEADLRVAQSQPDRISAIIAFVEPEGSEGDPFPVTSARRIRQNLGLGGAHY